MRDAAASKYAKQVQAAFVRAGFNPSTVQAAAGAAAGAQPTPDADPTPAPVPEPITDAPPTTPAPEEPETPEPAPEEPETPEPAPEEPETPEVPSDPDPRSKIKKQAEAEKQAAEETVEEKAKQKILGIFEFEEATLDNVDLLLTAGSIIPFGWGCMVGAVNSVFNFSRGEWLWGAFDAVFAMPPICGSAVGETASAGKGLFKVLTKLGGKSPKALAKAAKQAAKVGKTLGGVEKAALKNFDQAVKVTEKGMAKVIGKEAAEKYSKKYVGKLLGAIKGKKTKEQVSAVLSLLPDSLFENMDEVLNKPVKDIWGAKIVAKMDKLLESVGVDLVGEKYEELLNGAQVDMVLFLANKSGALSDDAYPEMTKTIAEIRKSANADKSLSAEERIEKFIADDPPAEPSPAPSAHDVPKFQQEHMIYERWQKIAGINKKVL